MELIKQRIPAACLLVFLWFFLWSAVVIISLDYMPTDDGLRHVGQAVCQKDWNQILVMGSWPLFDIHFGWKTILFFLFDHGMPKESLLYFSIVFMLALNFALPAFVVKRPEVWALCLIIGLCVIVNPMRYMLGRPFLSQVAAVALIGLSAQHYRDKFDLRYLVFLYLVLTLSMTLRAVWFLFLLPIGCYLMAGEAKKCYRLAIVWALAVVTAAALSLEPYEFFVATTKEVFGSAQRPVLSWMRVGELVPRLQSILDFLPMILLILWRKASGKEIRSRMLNPMFILVCLSWVLSMKVNRFWPDFGVPAYFVWLYEEVEEIFNQDLCIPLLSFKRPLIALCTGLVFCLVLSGDFDGRWSKSMYNKAPDLADEKTRQWLPEPDGIFYNISMDLFYKTFYANPNAPWRYFLGPDATVMPKENLDIYHQIMFSLGAKEKLSLIVFKMTPKDRFVLEGKAKPDIAGLEWFEIKPQIWSGRIPR